MQNSSKYLVVIGGATATGKTALSIEVARHFNTEILSADSRQFYHEMTIGVAKPSPEELAAVPHHFINSLTISQEYSAGDYEHEALRLLEALFEKHDIVLLAGGSGLFIRALCEGLDSFPEVPESIKKEVEKLFSEGGIPALQAEVLRLDPVWYARADVQNPQRLMRALSVCRASGQPFSSFQQQVKPLRPFKPVYILLQMERPLLYEKINRRVESMMEAGLLEEARSLFPHRHLNALQTVGYQELFRYLEGKISLADAVGLIKQNSRRYAKRQETWFRKDPHWRAFRTGEVVEVIDYIRSFYPPNQSNRTPV
jgi:tRNA dimethylallyltransferase